MAANKAHDFALQIRDRGEDASADDLTLEFGEPKLDLVEPGRVSRGIMKVHVGMSGEKFFDLLGLVGGKIVGNEMDRFGG